MLYCPFCWGGAIAYFLDPVTDWFETHGVSRVAATALVTTWVVMTMAFVTILILPLMIDQIRLMISAAPEVVSEAQVLLSEKFPGIFEEDSTLRRAFTAMEGTIKTGAVSLVENILSSSFLVIDMLIVVVLAPVISFYLLLDWDRMIARIDDLIPREHVDTVRDLASQVDKVLGGFVRGQLSVCAILGLFYAVALLLAGLKFGIVIGLLAGLISFIPFIGSIIGGLLSVGLATVQFWNDPIWIAVIAGIFGIGQVVEGNVLTPYLVGGSVGLHPVWLMFALSAFGSFFGFSGLLIAVPAAAVIGVLTRFILARYRQGRLYQGPQTGAEPDA